MKITLMHPPLDDPTLPYHSTAYLMGHLIHNGFTQVFTRDLNIEFVNYCLQEKVVNRFFDEGERYLRDLGNHGHLDLLQQDQFINLWAHERIDAQALGTAAALIRSRESFLDYDSYLGNVKLLNRYFSYLGALSYPAGISNFKQVTRANYSIYNFNDLFNFELADRVCMPFAQFFEERVVRDPEFSNTDCFGISIVYDHQMVHALWLARELKRRWPEKLLLLGGTSISQYYKHMRDKSHMKR